MELLVKGEFPIKRIRKVWTADQTQDKMSHDLWTEATLYHDVDQPQVKSLGVS